MRRFAMTKGFFRQGKSGRAEQALRFTILVFPVFPRFIYRLVNSMSVNACVGECLRLDYSVTLRIKLGGSIFRGGVYRARWHGMSCSSKRRGDGAFHGKKKKKEERKKCAGKEKPPLISKKFFLFQTQTSDLEHVFFTAPRSNPSSSSSFLTFTLPIMNATIPKIATAFGLDQKEHSDVLLECKHIPVLHCPSSWPSSLFHSRISLPTVLSFAQRSQVQMGSLFLQ